MQRVRGTPENRVHARGAPEKNKEKGSRKRKQHVVVMQARIPKKQQQAGNRGSEANGVWCKGDAGFDLPSNAEDAGDAGGGRPGSTSIIRVEPQARNS